MGNLCCSSALTRQGSLSSININDIIQRASVVDRQLDQMDSSTNQVNIKALTWNKDSYDLFDFENSQKLVQNIVIDKPVKLYRDEQSGEVVDSVIATSHEKILLNVEFRQKCFWIIPKQKSQPNIQSLWLVVKSIQSNSKIQGLRLGVQDVIRIGKIEMRLKEICYDQQQSEIEVYRSTYISNSSENEQVCRLCLNGSETEDNPKISPCQCTGTMALIHLQCLQQWIATKYNIHCENQNVIAFYWDQMKCELCKSQFNRQIEYGGRMIDLVQKSKNQFKNYAIFEIKRKLVKHEEQIQKVTYILNLDSTDGFKIGRANDNHIRLCDISVSRFHCRLSIQNKQLFIHDNGSKFGTLLKIKQPIPLLQELNQVQVQAGRTVFEFDTCDYFQYQLLSFQGYHKLF